MDINIPKDIEVVKDEFQDMGKDFAVIYEIKLTNETMKILTKSVRDSKFINHNFFLKDYVSQDIFVEHDEMKVVWVKTDFGYIFQNDFERNSYSARIGTINFVAKFNESHD